MESVSGLIVVLGSPNSDIGELYSIAKGRCELALAEHKRRSGWKFLLTGGYGAHFNTTDQPHAAYLKQYLLKRDIPKGEIVEFAESTNTLEDASYSRPIVIKYGVGEILVVTSDYHEDRARYVFGREFADTEINIAFSLSKTDEELCEFDLNAQKKHEREALAKLREKDKTVTGFV